MSAQRFNSRIKRQVKKTALALGAEGIFKSAYSRYRWQFYRKAGAIFTHIPKAAGTSVATMVYGRRLGHHRLRDIAKENPAEFDEMFRFTVVRDPIDRFLSAHRFLAGRGGSDGTVNHLERYEEWMFQDIERFIGEWLPKQDLEVCNPIFRRQTHYVDASDIAEGRIDHIARLEQIDALAPVLTENANVTVDAVEERNVSHSRPKVVLSEDAISVLNEIYAEDFETFGYDRG